MFKTTDANKFQFDNSLCIANLVFYVNDHNVP